MRNRIKILFYPHRIRGNRNGTVPIFCRISSRGEVVNFATGIRCQPEKWNTAKKTILRSHEADRGNQKLAIIKSQLEAIGLDMEAKGMLYNARDVYTAYQGYVAQHTTLGEIALHYIEYQFERQKANKISVGSFTTLKYDYSNVKKFLREANVLDTNLNYLHQDTLKIVAKKMEHKLCGRGINRTIKFIISALRHAASRGAIEKIPSLHFEPFRVEEKEIVYLTSNELALMEGVDTSEARLQEAKDIFLFSCYTGLAYADLKSLSKTNIQEYNGRMFIVKQRTKGRSRNYGEFAVPLRIKAVRILEKYAFRLPVPRFSSAYNKELKTVARLAGLKKQVSSHTGRKTFAMLALNEFGIPLETVSAMIGHSSMVTTQKYYAKVNIEGIDKNTKKTLF